VLEKQIDEAERRATLRNDLKVKQEREQASTYHAHAQADLEIPGRFGALGKAQVTGTSEAPKYPACSPALAVQLPDEPPTGVAIDQLQRD
jgi:hypothetical protein